MSVTRPPAMTPEIRFREVFDQAPISMQLLAADGRTLQVNKAWETMWQGSLGDALNEYVLHGGYNVLTDPQLQAKGITAYLLRAFAGEAVGWMAVPLKAQDGSNIGIVQACDKGEGDFTAEGQAIMKQLASIAASGFENARLYETLQEQQRRKDEFLAMLAHELRNPLAPIRKTSVCRTWMATIWPGDCASTRKPPAIC